MYFFWNMTTPLMLQVSDLASEHLRTSEILP